MSLPRTRSTKDKATPAETAPESRWKSLELHGIDPGEIYGHTIVHHAPTDSLYLFGGCSRTGSFHNNVIRFQLSSQHWEVLQTEGKRPKGRHFHSAVVLDNLMYIFGGKCNGYMNDMSCLDIISGEWLEMEKADGSLPSRRYGHSMVVYNRNFYIYGGYDDYGYKCNDLYEYRPLMNKWCRVTTLGAPPERYHHSAVAFSGSMYVFGGNSGDPTTGSALYEYRFGTATWTRIPTQNKPPEPRWGHSSFIHEEHLYIIGGCDNILCFKDIHRISLSSLAWKKVKKLTGFDPRYFGGCVLLKSDHPTCTYDPSIHDPPAPEPPADDANGASGSANTNTSAASGQGVTVIHHSTAVVAAVAPTNAAPRTTAAAITVTANFNVTRVATPPTAAMVSSSSGSQLAASSQPPPLPAVTPTSPLPMTSKLGLGVKVLYHGGRNIHNWAFSDILVLSLEPETGYNPYETQMKDLIDSENHFCDVAFHFPNEPEKPPIRAHKAILSIRCEPFFKMFSLLMAESNVGKIDIIDTHYDLFKTFLTFVYTGVLPPMDSLQEYSGMLYLADKYFLAYLKGQCEARLKPFISFQTLPLLWETARAAHASSLQRSCVRFVARFSEVLLTSSGKKTLPKSLVIEAKAKLAQLSSSSN